MLFRRYELLKTLFLFRCRQFSLKEPKPFGYVATKADPNFLRNLKSSLEAYGDDQDSSVKSRTIKRPSSSKSIQEQAYFFAQEIKKLINSGRIQSALELFEEIKIKYRYIFHPTNSYDVRQSATTIFTTLMSGLARDGNVDKVLELHRDVKSHNLILNAVVYVTLFNAFANSSAIHTDRIMQIIHEIKTRKIFVNTRVALSLMKALVHSGAVEPLFDGEIFRMLNWKLYPLLKNDPMFYRYLLMGCTNDKERGTARMFNVLREMHSLEIPVDRSHVHSVLLCLRECGIGSDRSFAVQTIVDSKLIEEPKSQSLKSMIVKDSDNELDIIEEESHPQTLLSVLDKNVTTSGLVHALYAISKNPQDKLQCIGGVEGAIHAILHNGEQPDIRTFDLLLQVGGLRVFEDILSSMKTHNVTPDADFFNRAIFQASITNNHDSIPTILDNFRDFDLSPNKKSICTLARSCTNVQNAQEIISKIHYFPDVSLENVLMEILEAGLGRRSPQLLKFFFREILEHKIKIEKEVILKLEDFFSDANFKELFRQNLLNKEKYQRNYDHLNSVKLLNYVEFLQKVVVNKMMYDWKQNCDRAASVKIFERVFPVKARTIEEQIYKEAISYEDYQSKVITAQQKFKHQIQEVLGKLVNQLSYFKKLEEQLLNHDFKEEANYWKKIITFLQNRDKQNVDLVQAQKIQVTIEKSLQEVRQKLKAAAASQVSNANSRPVPQAAIGQVTAIAQSSPNVEPSPSQETDPYSHLFQLLGTTSRNRTINNTLHRTFASAVELLDMEKLLPSNDNDPTKFSDLDEHVYISLDPRIPTVSHVVQYEIIHAKHECNTKLLSPSWEIWPCSLLLQRANCDCPSLEVSISLDYPSDSPKYSLVNKDDDYVHRFEKKLGMLELPFTLTDLIRLTAHCCLCKRDL